MHGDEIHRREQRRKHRAAGRLPPSTLAHAVTSDLPPLVELIISVQPAGRSTCEQPRLLHFEQTQEIDARAGVRHRQCDHIVAPPRRPAARQCKDQLGARAAEHVTDDPPPRRPSLVEEANGRYTCVKEEVRPRALEEPLITAALPSRTRLARARASRGERSDGSEAAQRSRLCPILAIIVTHERRDEPRGDARWLWRRTRRRRRRRSWRRPARAPPSLLSPPWPQARCETTTMTAKVAGRPHGQQQIVQRVATAHARPSIH